MKWTNDSAQNSVAFHITFLLVLFPQKLSWKDLKSTSTNLRWKRFEMFRIGWNGFVVKHD